MAQIETTGIDIEIKMPPVSNNELKSGFSHKHSYLFEASWFKVTVICVQSIVLKVVFSY